MPSPPGGPVANPFAAFDELCETDACRAQGFPRVFVSLSDLTLYVRVSDLTLGGPEAGVTVDRLYAQDGAAGGAFGGRWSFSLDESLTAGEDSSYSLRRGTGRIDRFALGAGSGSYFAVTATSDTLARNGDGSFTVSSTAGASRTFSAAGRLVSIREGAALRAAFEYDGAGRLTTVRSLGRSLRFGYGDGGRISSVADSAGRTVSYAYNGQGLLASQANADGSTVEYRYNDAGLIVSISRNGAVTSIEYSGDEGFRAVAKITMPDGSIRTYDTPRSAREIRVTRRDGATLYTAGATGLVESITDASGNRTSYVYDGAGRRTRVTNGAGETTRFEYDAAGNPSAVVDGAGARWTADWSEGRVARITDPNGQVWQFGYEGGLLSAVAPPAGLPGAARFNASGRVASIDLYGLAGSYEYNADGLAAKFTDATGKAATYEYDGAGRVQSRTDGGGTIRAVYGAGPRPTAYTAGDARVPAGDSSIERDPQGRVVQATDSFGNQVAYGWDAAGRLARISLPGNRGIAYEYDRNGRLAKVSDSAGNFAVYSYDAAGQPVSVNISGGPATVYQYDAAHNLRATVSTGPDGSPVAGWRYTLDGGGNRTAIGSLEPYSLPFRFTAAGFGYDAARRPISRESGTAYRYDARGNPVSVEGGPDLAFGYDAFGRLQSVSGDFSASYSYDGYGLRVARTLNGQVRRFVYDVSRARPRLLMETDGSNNLVAWYVHGLAPLWRINAGGRVQYYHLDGDGNVAAMSDSTAGVVNRYRYDALGRLVASEEAVENPLRAGAAHGVVDDGNGVLFGGGRFFLPELRLAAPGAVDLSPPSPDLTPPLGPAGMCLFQGVADCALSGARRTQ